MEEDIKVLENWLKELDELFEKTKINNTKERTALRNLIADNKRLDKENQALFEAYNFNDTNLLARILKEYRKEILNSIPKSKVREIIQKYYDVYEKEKEYRYTLDVEDEQKVLREIEQDILQEGDK